MRMSLTKICGTSSSLASAASTSRALEKLRVGSCSRNKAFSSTKRIDWSSSTIQIGFIGMLSFWFPTTVTESIF
jgi:hypothetical protein